jgi:hypothetical protein
MAYAIVFTGEGVLFLFSAVLAARLGQPHRGTIPAPLLRTGEPGAVMGITRG